MRSFPAEVEQALITSQDAFAWEAPSFPSRERGTGWYLALAIGALFLIAYAVWSANFLFAFLILLGAVLLILAAQRKPRPVLVQVGDHGIVWDGQLTLFQDLDTFAIVYQPPISKTLYIERRNGLVPRLAISLEGQDPVALREHLRQYMREDLDLQTEHLSDIVARLLRL